MENLTVTRVVVKGSGAPLPPPVYGSTRYMRIAIPHEDDDGFELGFVEIGYNIEGLRSQIG